MQLAFNAGRELIEGRGNPYRKDPTIHRCIQSYINQLQRVELELRDAETKEPVTSAERNPIRRRLFERIEEPNTERTKRTFIGEAAQHLLENQGQASIYKDQPDSTGVPVALVVLPGTMEPVYSSPAWWEVREWKYTGTTSIGPAFRPYAPEEIIHIEYARDLHDRVMRSFGVLDVVDLVTKTDHEAATLNFSQLSNGGIPAALLFNKNPNAKKTELDEFLRRFKEQFSGSSKRGKVGAFGGDWDMKTFDVTNQEMEWLEGRKFNLGEKARGTGTPKLLLGEYDANGISYASALVIYRMFFEQSLIPFGMALIEALNTKLVKVVDPRLELVFRWDLLEAMREDLGVKLDQFVKLWDRGVPLSECNRILGMGVNETLPDGSPMPGFNVGFIQGQPVEQVLAAAELDRLVQKGLERKQQEPPVETASARANAVLEVVRAAASAEIPVASAKGILTTALHLSSVEADLALAGCEPAAPKEHEPPALPQLSAPAGPAHSAAARPTIEFAAAQRSDRIRLWMKMDRKLAPVQKRAGDALVGHLRSQANRLDRLVRKVLKKHDVAAHRTASGLYVFEAKEADDISGEVVDGFDVDGFLETIYGGIEEAWGLGVKTGAQDLRNQGIELLDSTALKTLQPKVLLTAREPRLRNSADLISTALGETISEGMNAGEGIAQIAARVQRVMGASITHARTIAVTETATARDVARFELAREQGIKRFRWLSARDEYVRGPDSEKSPSKFDHDIDGEVAEFGDTFSNGLRFPHDPEWDGEAGNIVNCRCCYEVMGAAEASARARLIAISGRRAA